MDFPLTRAALERRAATFPAANKQQPSFKEPREVRAEWQRAQDAAAAAYEKVANAYATELLPAITGGRTWKRTTRAFYAARSGRRRKCYVEGEFHGLFDHALTFRNGAGTKTWHSCALIGQPYPDISEDEADKLCAEFPVGVWARDDLSAWYPGWTMLVVAADRYWLKPEAATQFGFRAVGLVQCPRA